MSFGWRSVRVSAPEDGADGLEKNLEIERRGPVLHIEEIVKGSLFDARLASEAVDLGPARYTRLFAVPLVVAWDEPTELLDEEWPFGSRANQTHVSEEHVDELG